MSVTFAANIEKWRKWFGAVDSLVDSIPDDIALKWTDMESGGNVCSVGRVENGHVYEAGLAQTYFDTPATVKYGVTSQQLRADCAGGGTTMPGTNSTAPLSDARRILHARVALLTMKDARKAARERLAAAGVSWPESSADFWSFVKLNHVLPALQKFLAPCIKALGFKPTWTQFRAYVESLSVSEMDSLAPIVNGWRGRIGSVPHFFDVAEELGAYAPGTSTAKWLLAVGVGGLLLWMNRGALKGALG
jgi:hypothetical protein